MYNPYEAEILRRRQQSEIPQIQVQQPAPVAGLPLYAGPELPQWVPMDDGQSQDFSGAGMAALLKRFKPGGAPSSAIHEAGHVAGNVASFGPRFTS